MNRKHKAQLGTLFYGYRVVIKSLDPGRLINDQKNILTDIMHRAMKQIYPDVDQSYVLNFIIIIWNFNGIVEFHPPAVLFRKICEIEN